MSTEATTRQKLPLPGRFDVTSQVINDLYKRSAEGEKKYGTKLQTHNGRDPLIDAYQEALDLCCYLKQAIMERHGG